MKNIKTSKIVALVLSIAMILNVFAGLSLTSFAADITVGMYFMDQNNNYSTPSEFVAGQAYTAVVTLQNYNATNAAAYPISGLQIDVAVDSQVTTGYVGTYEKSGYSFDGTTDFASATTDDNGNAIVRFASVYGAPADDGSFAYTALASSETTIEVFAFIFTVSENATGTVSFPMTVIATDASLSTYDFVVNSRTMSVTAAATKSEISLYGPDLEAINSEGTYAIDDATAADGTGYTPFGTSWTAAGFAEGSSLVRMGYGNFVYLGDFDFSDVTKIEMTYHTDGTFTPDDTANAGETYSLGLNKVAQSFGWATSEATNKSDFSNAIAYGSLTAADAATGWTGERTLTITEGIDTTYSGATYLATYGCNGQVVVVTSVVLYRSSETVDPSATTEPTTTVEPTATATAEPVTTAAFEFNTDNILTDGTKVEATGIGGTSKMVWANYGHLPTLSITDTFVIQGWLVTANGVASYEMSVNGGEWTAIDGGITSREDLADKAGYETAGFNITIPVSALVADTSNTVDIRFVDSTGLTGEFVQYTIYAGEIVEVFDEYQVAVDFYWVDGGDSVSLGSIGGVGAVATVADTITASETVRFAGWLCTAAGMSSYEYSLDGTTWNAISEYSISDRSADLVANNIPYSDTGAATAGFDVVIPVTGFAEGTNNLTVRGIDLAGNEIEFLKATVVYEPAVVVPTTYTVSVGTVSNGTVTVSPSGTVDEGTTVTVTATAATGYELSEILVNGTAITGTTFTVTADSVVTATFTKIQYTVSVGTVSNGTVTLDPTGTVDYGTTVTVTATAADGYELSEILVNGTAITGTTFTVTADSVVTATFTASAVEEETYTITVVLGGKGTGSVTVFDSAKAGDTIDLTAEGTVNALGYACVATAITSDSVTLTTTQAATGAYTGATFTMPSSNVTITVNFQVLGDVNLDGSIKNGDATALKRYNAGLSTLTAEKLIAANVVGTSNANITAGDVTALARFLAGATTSFANGSY